ncbi:MAG: FapA family protein [Clostridia bacterium]|nr:FapA family protein [Clostridia bacterium]
MDGIIFTNEFVNIYHSSGEVYLETFKKGFPPEQLMAVLSINPQISINSFAAIRASINNAPKPPEKIGILKERICIKLLDGDLKALVVFNLSNEELRLGNRHSLIKECSCKLKEKGIVYGIKNDLFSCELEAGKEYTIAEGTPPVNGTDSKFKMYELMEAKPEILEDGKVDFYELKLINRVQPGDWLGERTDPTPGIPGQTVLGVPIKAMDGKSLPLVYDKATIREVHEEGKTVLYSRIAGAVSYKDGKITVSNHLDIDGDVDFKTGNIKFDGYVTIKGTVADGFTVEATKDIEINSPMGIGHVKRIYSKEGSIYIKGGIFARGKVEITAGSNVFTKFADNAVITCGEKLHIGFYCNNCNIKAKEVIVEASNGHILGGRISALTKVSAAYIGSEFEKRTEVEVKGFNRESLKQDLDSVFHSISELKNDQQLLKVLMAKFEGVSQPSRIQRKEYDDCFEKLLEIRGKIKALEEKRKNIANYLKARGDGEITISNKAYPNCLLIIGGNRIELSEPISAVTYYLQDGMLKSTV